MKKLAIITGATSGIGYEITKLIAKEDVDILMISRNKDKMETVKKELELFNKNKISILSIDLSKNLETDFENIVNEIGDRSIKYFINNSGFGDYGEFSSADIEKQRNMINLNILALTNLTKIFFDNVKSDSEAYLLNVASVASFMSGPLMSVYYATKAYVLSFTRALIYENRENKNIHISVLCPGPTKTNFIKSSNLENSGLFNKLKIMSAYDVARIGFSELKKGKKVIIPGINNKIGVILNKFAPSSLVSYIVYKINKKK
ncbi:SDR family NAD(P)-dependent oxidoreductase [Oceanivirga salmonicida]|uniref:SDR family NAD(P)-dependent oxidoreductase n=1 Tax=Oceanivirga salmonicida TaxID=1769291 RepID=UPI0012E1B7C8|nr:SDR family oxidoreductase [Oceanivirga salmonicida]